MKKRWHRIPIVLVSVLLAIVLIAGGVFAITGYKFFEAPLSVEVEEAMVLGVWNPTNEADSGWDNLEPYGSVDDVVITLGGTEQNPAFCITTIEGYAGAGFVAGEWIVLPVNFRNAGDGELNLEATILANNGGFEVSCIFQENTGPMTTQESGQDFCREFEASGTWESLDAWTGAITGKGGKSGSAVVGAEVLFVRISAPGDIGPGNYEVSIAFGRS